MSMTKKEAKEKAKKILQSIIGVAYYKLENEKLAPEDAELITSYINQYGERCCKAIGVEYVTY